MSVGEKVKLVLDVFSAIERRDGERFGKLLSPDFEILGPPSSHTEEHRSGPRAMLQPGKRPGFRCNRLNRSEEWNPHVVAANEDSVVVLWRQRGIAPDGDRFEGEVLGLYRIREGKVARARMFHYDTSALVRFLEKNKASAKEELDKSYVIQR